jgi:hypothetical protein
MPKPAALTLGKPKRQDPTPALDDVVPPDPISAKKDYGEAMNLRLPRPVAKRFRQMALDHDKKLNEMFVELVRFYDAERDRPRA